MATMNAKQLVLPRGMNIVKLSEESGLSYHATWKIVHGQTKRLSVDAVARLAAAMGITPSTLLKRIRETFGPHGPR